MAKTPLLIAMAALANRIRINGDNDAVSIETGTENVLLLEQIVALIVQEGELEDPTPWEDIRIWCSSLRAEYRRNGTDADGQCTQSLNEATSEAGI